MNFQKANSTPIHNRNLNGNLNNTNNSNNLNIDNNANLTDHTNYENMEFASIINQENEELQKLMREISYEKTLRKQYEQEAKNIEHRITIFEKQEKTVITKIYNDFILNFNIISY